MAKDWRRPTDAARKHWKQREAGQTSTAARGVKRLVFTILSVVLVGILIWFLIPGRQKVYLAYLAEDYGPTIRNPAKVEVAMLPPAVASSSGVFKQVFAPLGERIFPNQFTVADIADAGNSKLAAQNLVKSLTAPLKDKWNLGEVEFLVLYVSAHGVSIDGEPYLMWNEDYAGELMRSTSGTSKPSLMKLDDLLAQIGQLGAQQKMLVLDSGQLDADPRIGMFVNEFPRLATESIKKTDDPSLWVLTSHSSMERAHVFAADRTSVFGRVVSDGMAGASLDPEKNDDLSLRSFVGYVVSNVQRVVGDRTGAVQTPQFINGRSGALSVDNVPDIVFLKETFFNKAVPATTTASLNSSAGHRVAINNGNGQPDGGFALPAAMATLVLAQAPSGATDPAANPAVPAAPQQPAATSPPATSPPATSPPATTPPTTPPAAPATPPATTPSTTVPPTAPATSPPAVETPPIAQPAPTDGKRGPPKTVDFSVVWHAVESIEDPDKSPEGWSPIDYAPHLWAQLRRQLTWYETQYLLEAASRQENSKFIDDEILKPLNYLVTRDGAAPPTSIQMFDRLEAARTEFLGSKAATSAADRTRDSVKNFVSAVRLKNYLTFRVAEQVRYYGYVPDTTRRYEGLVEAINKLQEATRSLEEDSQASLQESTWGSSPAMLDDLRKLRSRLHESKDVQRALINVATVPAETPLGISKAKATEVTDMRPARWVDLYVRLAALSTRETADHMALISAAGSLDPAFADNVNRIRLLAGGNPPTAGEETYWTAYRGVGRQLRAFTEVLKVDLNPESLATLDDLKLCGLERRLRLIDGRDAPGLPVGNCIALRQLCPTVAPRVEIVLAETKVSLPPSGAGSASQKTIALQYRWSGKTGAQATLTVKYRNENAAKDIVTLVSGSINEPIKFNLQSEGVLPPVVVAQSEKRRNASNTVPATLQLIVKVPGEPGVSDVSKDVLIEAHGSELVQVAAYRVRAGIDEPIGVDKSGEQGISSDDEFASELPEPIVADGKVKARFFQTRIRPFPNRADQYRFKLTNLSGEAGTRVVNVSVYAPLFPIDEAELGGLFTARGDLDPSRLQAIAEFGRELTLTNNAAVTFPFTPEAKPAAEGEKPADAAAAAPPAGEEKKEPGPPKPIADFRYGLVFEVRDKGKPELRWYHWVNFIAREPSRYVTHIVTYDNDAQQLDIRIVAREDATQPPDGFSAKWSVENATIDPDLTQTMEVGRQGNKQILLGVTGWNPPKPGGSDPPILLFITVDGYPRAFVLPFRSDLGPDKMKDDGSFRRVKIVEPSHSPFAYAKAKEGNTRVRIGIEADGPATDELYLTFSDGNHSVPTPIYAKRAQHVWLFPKGWDKDNVLTLNTTIGDFVGADAIAFDTAKTEAPIPVEVELKSGQQTPKDHAIEVVVDNAPPKLTQFDLSPLQAFAVDDLTVTVKGVVDDPAGVTKVEFFVFADGRPKPEAKELEKADFVWEPKPNPDGSPAMVTRPTAISQTTPFSRGPGRWVIWAVAVNQAGNKTDPIRTESVFVVEKAPEKPMPGMGGNVVITGTTLRTGDPIPKMTVELIPVKEGVGEPQSTISADPNLLDGIPEATYRFEGVAPGEYRIVASGEAASSRKIVGEVKVVITDKDKGTKKHDIVMEVVRGK